MCFVTEKTMAYWSRLSRMFWNNYLRLCQSHLVRDLKDSHLHVGENKQIKTQISKSTTVSQEECVNVLHRVFLTTEPIVFNRVLELSPRSDFDIGLSRDKTESVMRWNHRLSIGGILNYDGTHSSGKARPFSTGRLVLNDTKTSPSHMRLLPSALNFDFHPY